MIWGIKYSLNNGHQLIFLEGHIENLEYFQGPSKFKAIVCLIYYIIIVQKYYSGLVYLIIMI